jgi:hypothetical protein
MSRSTFDSTQSEAACHKQKTETFAHVSVTATGNDEKCAVLSQESAQGSAQGIVSQIDARNGTIQARVWTQQEVADLKLQYARSLQLPTELWKAHLARNAAFSGPNCLRCYLAGHWGRVTIGWFAMCSLCVCVYVLALLYRTVPSVDAHYSPWAWLITLIAWVKRGV